MFVQVLLMHLPPKGQRQINIECSVCVCVSETVCMYVCGGGGRGGCISNYLHRTVETYRRTADF